MCLYKWKTYSFKFIDNMYTLPLLRSKIFTKYVETITLSNGFKQLEKSFSLSITYTLYFNITLNQIKKSYNYLFWNCVDL